MLHTPDKNRTEDNPILDESIEAAAIVAAYNSDDKQKKAWAMEEMINQVDGFIGYMIRKHFSAFMSEYYHDLYEEGVVAVIESMGGFDSSKGTLTTYFTPRILHAMSNFINHEVNKSSSYYAGNMNRVRAAVKYFHDQQIRPTISDISLHTGLSISKVEDSLRRINATDEFRYTTESELDQAVKSSSLSPEEEYIKKEGDEILGRALLCLNAQDRTVLLHKYGFHDGKLKSNGAVAKLMGIPVNQVVNSLNRSKRILSKNESLCHFAGATGKLQRKKELADAAFSFQPDKRVLEIYAGLGADDTDRMIRRKPKNPANDGAFVLTFL